MQRRSWFRVREDERVESKDETRNREYLKLIFKHRPALIQKTLQNCGGVYSCAYDELVRAHGHGTPGRSESLRHGFILMPSLKLGGSRVDLRNSSLQWKKERLRKAYSLVDSFKKWPSGIHEFWSKEWGDTYEGFLKVQRELGVLRDEISDRKCFGEQDEYMYGRSLTGVRQELSFMLRSSAGEWYKRWGELDLHRLCERDALKSIAEFMKQPPWNEMRIVAGQRRHVGDDHHSEGVLYDLIHRLFDNEHGVGATGDGAMAKADEEPVRNDIRRTVERHEMEVLFYSNGAAVHLRKRRRSGMQRRSFDVRGLHGDEGASVYRTWSSRTPYAWRRAGVPP